MVLIIVLLAMVAAFVWGYFLISLVPQKEEVAVRRRLERLRMRRALRSEEAMSIQAESIADRIGFWIYQGTWPILSRLLPAGYLDYLKTKVTQAGRYDLTIGQLFAQKLGSAVLFGLLVGASAWLIFEASPRGILVAGVVGLLLGFFLMDLQILSMAGRRKTLIERQLPDFLDQLIVTIQAGLAPNAAIQFTTKRFRAGPLREEFEIALQEIMLGAPRIEALQRLAQRTQQEDIRRLVMMLAFGERLGIPLTQTLAAVAEDLRNKRWEKGEKLAHEAPVKIVFPTLILVLPTIILIIFAPMAINYFLKRGLYGGGSP